MKRRYNFLNLQAILTSDPIFSIYYYIYFFQSKRITKKTVKVIEDEIYGKLFEIYKRAENTVLVKFVEAIPFSGSHLF